MSHITEREDIPREDFNYDIRSSDEYSSRFSEDNEWESLEGEVLLEELRAQKEEEIDAINEDEYVIEQAAKRIAKRKQSIAHIDELLDNPNF